MSTKSSASGAKAAATESKLAGTADTVVEQLDKVNEKVTKLRNDRASDPETAGDKVVKAALPALSGAVAGKAFQLGWNAIMKKIHPSPDDDAKDRQQGLLMSMLFAALSAAFCTAITSLSTKGSNALVRHWEAKRSK